KLCNEAIAYGFFSACIPPAYVLLAKKILRGTDVKVCTVIGFPHGLNDSPTKVFEIQRAFDCGADEFDAVINISMLKSGDERGVKNELLSLVKAAQGKTLKVIIETALLTDAEKVLACRLSEEAGANFVKTSTGFAGGGATTHDVQLMRATVGPKVQVKASGGIRNRATALAMIEAGASRLGTSQGVAIVSGDADPANKASY
ncbi:MAG: deoxyribose-phosphate aldolase, partial [Bdellovibrionota bacterium]